MRYIAKCENENCSKKEECARYLDESNTCTLVYRFENLCGEKNDYKWFYEQRKEEVIKKEEESGDRENLQTN